MKTDQTATQTRFRLRTLSHAEIETRIERALAQVTGPSGLFEESGPNDDLTPRWISTAEFVRRMKPFVVYN